MTTLTQEEVLPLSIGQFTDEAIRRHKSSLFDFIRRRVATREDAEDLLQDVFYQFVVNFDAAEPIQRLSAWLFTIARNKITDWYRRRKVNASLDFLTEEYEAAPILAELVFDPNSESENLLDRELFWKAFAEALDELPAAQREVFVKHEIEGKGLKEIAAETGVSLSAMLSRKHNAVINLRKRFRQFYELPDNYLE